MIVRDIPGDKKYEFSVLMLDFNGTIARNGRLIEGVKDYLIRLKDDIEIRVVTADTFGGVEEEVSGLGLCLGLIPSKDQTQAKGKYLQGLKDQGKEVLAIGNGSNDALMLLQADLSIAILGPEGLSTKALNNADIVCVGIIEALELILNEKALIATCRQ